MKAFTTNLITSLAATLLSINIATASDLEVRFEKSLYDEVSKELFVNVQVRSTSQEEINLAGQNYRFFYDSETLTLDTEASKSSLSGAAYTELSFESHQKGIAADQVNQLSFDDNLGFANFSIDLHDLRNGGVSISDNEWTTVARLKFEVKAESVNYDIVWGREGATDKYATAFVEMTKWVSSSKIDVLEVSYFGDLSSQEVSKEEVEVTAAIGPNPTTDYVNITLDNSLSAQSTVILRDMTGKQVLAQSLREGQTNTTVDLSNVTAATYIIEIVDNAASRVLTQERIIVAR